MQDGSLQLKVQEFWTCDERMISRGSVNKIATITSCQRSNIHNIITIIIIRSSIHNNNNNNNTDVKNIIQVFAFQIERIS